MSSLITNENEVTFNPNNDPIVSLDRAYKFLYRIPDFSTTVLKVPYADPERIDLQVTYNVPIDILHNFYLYLDSFLAQTRQQFQFDWMLPEYSLFSRKSYECFKKIAKKSIIFIKRPRLIFNIFEFLRYYLYSAMVPYCARSGTLGNKAYFDLLSRTAFKSMVKSLANESVIVYNGPTKMRSFFGSYFEQTSQSQVMRATIFNEMYGSNYIGDPPFFYFYQDNPESQIFAIREKALYREDQSKSSFLTHQVFENLTLDNIIASIFQEDYSRAFSENKRNLQTSFFDLIAQHRAKESSWSYSEDTEMLINNNVGFWDWFSPLPFQESTDPMGLLSRSQDIDIPIIEVRNYGKISHGVTNAMFGPGFDGFCQTQLDYGFKGNWPTQEI